MPGQLYGFYLTENFQKDTSECAYSLGNIKRKETVQFSTEIEIVETLLKGDVFYD